MNPLFIFFTKWLSKTNIFQRQKQYLKQNNFRKRIKSIGLFKPLSANPQNGQTHSNNSSATAYNIIDVRKGSKQASPAKLDN